MILHVDKLHLYFLCSFCWYFHKIVWLFYFIILFLTASPFFITFPFINFGDFCQAKRDIILAEIW